MARSIEPETRRVRVVHDGTTIADTTDALRVEETGLHPVFYVPRSDLLVDLAPSPTATVCGWKGTASYWSLPGLADAAWSYDDPMDEATSLQGRVAFYASKVDEITLGE